MKEKRFTAVKLLCICGLSGWLTSCEDTTSFPVVPEIEMVTENVVYTPGRDSIVTTQLTFKYLDGDGDLGYESNGDSLQTIFVEMLQKTDSSYETVKKLNGGEEDVIFAYSFESATPQGDNKAIRGEMFVDLKEAPLFAIRKQLGTLRTDTIAYGIYIRDRAGHTSNYIRTEDITNPEL